MTFQLADKLQPPHSGSADYSVDVHRTLPTSWASAVAPGQACGHIFQMREFLSVWANTYAARLQVTPFFVEVHDAGGRLLLQVPLAISEKRGIRVLTFADHGAADYNAPVLYPPVRDMGRAAAAALWMAVEAALPQLDVVDLEKMPARIREHANPLFLLADSANAESCHGSDLLRPTNEVESTQAQLKTLKRKWRGLEKLGPTELIVADTPAERAKLLKAALEQKQRRFEETRVPGFAESPQTREFFEQATDAFAEAGNLRFCALSVGGEIVATSWNVALGDVLYELMIGFAGDEWTKHSPGRVLNLMLLKWAKDHGYRYLDHGIGDEAWKVENCDTHVPLGRHVAARSQRGRLALAGRAIVARVRETTIYRHLRPWKWVIKRALFRR